MSNFTEQQAQAITTHDKNLVVAAGAGSGKTRVLVERYLSLLDAKGWRLSDLVAITFTRAAAAEMRERIRLELEARLRASTQNADQQARWSDLLAQMDGARISTIHSLCGDILRANASRIGLDPAFEVTDEITASLLLEDTIKATLRDFAESSPLKAPEHDVLRLLYDHYQPFQIEATLKDTDLLVAPLPETLPTSDEILAQWDAEWMQILATLRARLITLLTPFAEYAPYDDKTVSKWLSYAHQILTINPNYTDEDLLARAFELSKYKKPSFSKNNDEHTKIKYYFDAMRDELRNWFKQWTGEIKPANLPIPPSQDPINQSAVELIPAWYHLIRAVQMKYAHAKRQANQLDFNDLEAYTAHMLQHYPDVRERYRLSEFKHLLVDEFQDTNQLQWDIISALADTEHGGSVFIVGDLKQSIYAFRGADVSVFKRVREHITRDSEIGEPIALARSFRSHTGLINFFNAFFTSYMQIDERLAPDWQINYDTHLEAHRTTTPDYAPLDLILCSQYPEGTKIQNEDLKKWQAYALAQHLQHMIEQGTLIYDKASNALRPIQYGDITILFRSMRPATFYEDAFTALHMPFVTVSGQGYYQQQEIWDILNLLKALYNPADDLALASVLHAPLFNISDEGLFILRRHTPDRPDATLWQQLRVQATSPDSLLTPDDRHAIQRAIHILDHLAHLCGRVRIAQLLRTALAQTGYLVTLNLLPDGVRRRRNVEKLIQIAEDSRHIALGDFTRHFEQLTGRQAREGEATLETGNAIQLMTIHASKGLEFPVVCLVHADTQSKGWGDPAKVIIEGDDIAPHVFNASKQDTEPCFKARAIKNHRRIREEAEDKRLFYVATTRASDKLIIAGALTNEKIPMPNHWLGDVLTWLEYQPSHGMTTPIDQPERLTLHDVEVALHYPTYDAEALASLFTVSAASSIMTVSNDVMPLPPPNWHPVTIAPAEYVAHLAASELAILGGYQVTTDPKERRNYQERLRYRLLTDEAPQLVPAQRTASPRVTMRVIGDIVHEALRYWQFRQNTSNLEAILAGYAWQFRIVSANQRQEAIEKSIILLEQFRRSPLYEDIENAHQSGRRVYKELPFIYNTGKRIIHGVIDVLYESAPHQWQLVDYKTSAIKDFSATTAIDHARRYHLQVGVYAAAALRELGDVRLQVAIHYLRYQHTVTIPTQTWQDDLAQLENIIGEILP